MISKTVAKRAPKPQTFHVFITVEQTLTNYVLHHGHQTHIIPLECKNLLQSFLDRAESFGRAYKVCVKDVKLFLAELKDLQNR
jgi:hypothetical protein